MNVIDLISPDGQNDLLFQEPLRVLGIDLGTTNSTVAEIIYDASKGGDATVRCLPVEQTTAGRSWWNPLVPSIVALCDGQEIVGEGARQLRSHGLHAGLREKGNIFSSCKNDMGLKLTYHMAPAGYRNAADVSSRILAFLKQAALKDKALPSARSTVTVPASFQAAQRHDTLRAATLAELSLQSGDLLDEPIAALIGYLAEHDDVLVRPGESKHLLVFDFGGGTCDVAIFRLSTLPQSSRLAIAVLAVSRYHRLGGGDIDQAILYEVLLPQILKENRLEKFSLDFETKKNSLEPAFIGLAEDLKAGLCDKIRKADKYDHGKLLQTCPGEFVCQLPGGDKLTLTNPQLSFADFSTVMTPFINPDILCVKENEYRQTLSIFAPIEDALERCELETEAMDYCLLAGGSSLIPLVEEVMALTFTNAKILSFANADATQTAIARGAAINALSLALYQRPLIQPVCQETIALATESGPVDLVPKGAALPWPSGGGFAEATVLEIPQSSTKESVTLRVEVLACEASGHRPLLSELWQVPAPVAAGERIKLEYRYDQNQVLEIRARHAERDDVPDFSEIREHPLTHLVNPQQTKLRIDQTEEKLRAGEVLPDERRSVVMALAADCAELRQHEKAIDHLSKLLRQQNSADTFIINRMALYSGYMGDSEREERLYHEAIAADPKSSTPWFNLALLQQKQNRFKEAKESVNKAIALEPGEGPYYVLEAQIVRDMGRDFATSEFLKIGLKHFPELGQQDKWQLHWYLTAAEMRNDHETAKLAREERHRRNAGPKSTTEHAEGILPRQVNG